VLVWFDGQVVASEPAPPGEHHVALQTEQGQVEIRQAESTPIETEKATAFDRVATVSWGSLAPETPLIAPPQRPNTTPEPVVAEAPTEAPPAPSLSTLRAYYRDLNAGRFSADRYFAASVSRFIGMRRTTPLAIDRYMHDVFPTQFRDVIFQMDESTLREEGDSVFTYTERAKYLNVAKGDYEMVTSTARAQFDGDARLTELYQAKVLERLAGEAARTATFPAIRESDVTASPGSSGVGPKAGGTGSDQAGHKPCGGLGGVKGKTEQFESVLPRSVGLFQLSKSIALVCGAGLEIIAIYQASDGKDAAIVVESRTNGIFPRKDFSKTLAGYPASVPIDDSAGYLVAPNRVVAVKVTGNPGGVAPFTRAADPGSISRRIDAVIARSGKP
jgi:hypothetical protein